MSNNERGNDDLLVEELAAIEHERWAHWQRYMHSQGLRQPDGSLLMPATLVQRWERQTMWDAPITELTDQEKASDQRAGA